MEQFNRSLPELELTAMNAAREGGVSHSLAPDHGSGMRTFEF